jgi:hypothetical protein
MNNVKEYFVILPPQCKSNTPRALKALVSVEANEK